MSKTATDLVTLLYKRHAVLATLSESPTDPATLAEDTSVSQSTIYRILNAFEEWGLITTNGDHHSLTLFARLVLSVYDEFVGDVTAMAAHEAGDTPLWCADEERADALELVANRLDLLLFAQTPRDKRTLVAELPYARSTVDWTVRTLESAGFIQRISAGYVTTPIGQQISTRYRTLLATLTELLAGRDLLAYLPDECALPPAVVAQADSERADTATPYQFLAGVHNRLDTASRIRAVLPTLPNPQLIDVCHQQVVRHGAVFVLTTDADVAAGLASEFPGPFAEMTAAGAGTITTFTADTPPFGLILGETETGSVGSILVYSDQRMVGAFHLETDVALAWAEDYYERVQERAVETTTDWQDAIRSTSGVALSAIADPGRVEREAEGFVKVTAEYFAERAAQSSAIAWRAGFDLVDVHAGYAIERRTDESRQSLTDDLIALLTTGTDHALIGSPGSGKSTVCKSVACRWYEQGHGAVFYRESGNGVSFESPAILSAQLRATDGHTLVIVEDAVRAEANTVFRVMKEFRADPSVTFLVDSRKGEWDDPTAFPREARLSAYRTEGIETVTMPTFDTQECERLIQRFKDTTDGAIDASASYLLRDDSTAVATKSQCEQEQTSHPSDLLFVLHRLTLTADPIAREELRTPTTLTEEIHRTYKALYTESELALDVGILVNLLNATGVSVKPALVYALAETGEEVIAVRDTLSSLEGQIIFEEDNTTDAAPYRAVHEAWSELFLSHVLNVTDTTRVVCQRFERCLNALLELAADPDRRDKCVELLDGNTPTIDRIASMPTEWVDTTIEQLFQLGLDRPELAPLFETTSTSLERPTPCSPVMRPRCAQLCGRMYFYTGNHRQAKNELERSLALATEMTKTESLTKVRAQSHGYLGLIANENGKSTLAQEQTTTALAKFREIDYRLGEASCTNGLGAIAFGRGDLKQAVAYFEKSLEIYREIEAPPKWKSKCLNNLGRTFSLYGDYDRAERYLTQSIEISRSLDNTIMMSYSSINLTYIMRRRGSFDRAEKYCKQGLTLAQEIGMEKLKAQGLCELGVIALLRDEPSQAEEYVQRSLDLSHEIEDTENSARVRRCLGQVARKQGNFTEAKTHLIEALTLCREIDNRYEEAQTLVVLGDLACEVDNTEQARDWFVKAVEIYSDMDAQRDTIKVQKRLGEIYEVLGDDESALMHYEAVTNLVNEVEFIDQRESLSEHHATLTAHLDSEDDSTDTVR